MKLRVGIGSYLLFLIALLCFVLVFMWLTPQMGLKNVRWSPPAARTLDVNALMQDALLPAHVPAATRQALEKNLERPLFSMTRKPAPVQVVVQEKVVERDQWSDARVLGIFQGAISGAIVLLDAKPQRILLNEALFGWTLKQVNPNQVDLERDGQQRSITVSKPAGPEVHLKPGSAVELTIGTRAP